ncbi:ferrochelatase [Brumimicrobium aurantiacum]|uniref:Ferrochelatase n=1 Tax=Brumimicrobium aurantiacum TaxID=1737063 RepID=A0A3E1F114_9FLAO|nr:ferrochelatase [Brumimicrobium aurantiacum]RFC55500.1 ferrochelatase [Brumimicrobium aurantiacum]
MGKNRKKTGVLLIQLGTPDSPSKKDVKIYLKEFLNDPRVIDYPKLKRKLLVNGIIIPFRVKNSTEIYKELWELSGGVSPLLKYTESKTKLLQERFKDEDVTVHMAMRYRLPRMEDVLEEMRRENYDKIIILPLFPHYASASGGTAIEKAVDIIRKWWVIPEISTVPDFFDHEAYIDTIVERTKEFDVKSYDNILFSYHGLPDTHVDKVYDDGLCEDQPCETEMNDKNRFCYKAQCYATTRLIAEKLGLKESDYTVAFQSRLNKKWLTPFSDKVIEEWAEKGSKRILAFSPAFVADCLETIVEIGVEYDEDFKKLGGEKVQLVPSTNDHPRFIDCLEDLVRQRM